MKVKWPVCIMDEGRVAVRFRAGLEREEDMPRTPRRLLWEEEAAVCAAGRPRRGLRMVGPSVTLERRAR